MQKLADCTFAGKRKHFKKRNPGFRLPFSLGGVSWGMERENEPTKELRPQAKGQRHPIRLDDAAMARLMDDLERFTPEEK